MSEFILLEKLKGGRVVEYPLDTLYTLQAQPGAVYRVVDKSTGEGPRGLTLKRNGGMLEIEIDDETVAQIDEFYSDDGSATCIVSDGQASGDDVILHGGEAADVADGAVVWAAAADQDGGISGWVWAGGALAAGGILAAAAGSDGSDDGRDDGNADGDDADTTAPTLASASPSDEATDVAVDSDITLTFNEDIALGDSGSITIVNDDTGDEFEIDVSSHDGQLSVDGATLTIDLSHDLTAGSSYHVEVDAGAIADLSGNDYGGIDDSSALNFDTAASAGAADGSVAVVFDLVEGVSSDHSDRTFSEDVTYTIYIIVDSDSTDISNDGTSAANASATWGTWTGGENLGSDDTIILVGNDTHGIVGPAGGYVNKVTIPSSSLTDFGTAVCWTSGSSVAAAAVFSRGIFAHFIGSGGSGSFIFMNLWTGTWGSNPDSGATLGQAYLPTMPGGILTSQGLA